ncbi:MAG: hypothetical protein KF878_21240 [Planctomycetes bacterium]|nr:hypothetical protein [Planctomycetota bacterium]
MARLPRGAELHDLRTGKVTRTQRLRRLVMERDGGVCNVPVCGERGRLHVDLRAMKPTLADESWCPAFDRSST